METNNLVVSDRDFARLSPMTRYHPLDEELGRAIVVPEERMPDDIVRLYSQVLYLDESNGVRREVQLVLPEESDMERGRISILTPVGSALFGLKQGQSIEWPFPNGNSRQLTVVNTSLPQD